MWCMSRITLIPLQMPIPSTQSSCWRIWKVLKNDFKTLCAKCAAVTRKPCSKSACCGRLWPLWSKASQPAPLRSIQKMPSNGKCCSFSVQSRSFMSAMWASLMRPLAIAIQMPWQKWPPSRATAMSSSQRRSKRKLASWTMKKPRCSSAKWDLRRPVLIA